MNLETVEQLAQLMEKYGLASAEVCEGEEKISLAKIMPMETSAFSAGPTAVYQTPPYAAPGQASGLPVAEAAGPATPAKPGEELQSPLVGVAYLAPEPGAAPFVTEGMAVKKGQTLCIVETMKVMNEFTAPRDGTVSEVCVADGELVEHGQCLFRLV